MEAPALGHLAQEPGAPPSWYPRLAVAATLSLALWLTGAAWAEPSRDPAQEVARLVNQARHQAQFANLIWHPKLAQAALEHSREMALKGYFSHQSPTPERVELAQRLALVGANDWTAIAENIYQSSGPPLVPQKCLDLWMQSPGHRENLLDSQYAYTGVGVGRSRTGKMYVTQVFASFSQDQSKALKPTLEGVKEGL